MVVALADCFFYHSMNLPDGRHIDGLCDMRSSLPYIVDAVPLAGQRVLEIGPANGFFTFEMERRGADVTAVELGPDDAWDLIPHPGNDADFERAKFSESMNGLRNGFWYCHEQFCSNAKLVHSTVYDLPASVSGFQIGVLNHVLLHLRDPFRALQTVANRVSETLIISELEPFAESRKATPLRYLMRHMRAQVFMAPFDNPQNFHTWWHISAPALEAYCRRLGFPKIERRFYRSNVVGRTVPSFTLIAHR